MSGSKIANPAYRIETARLVVRCYQPSDAQMLTDSINESREHLKPWMAWAHGVPETVEERVKNIVRWRGMFDLGQDYGYGIFNREETKQLGGTGLHTRLGDNELEIGYWLHKDFINQGLITESTAALIRVAFEIIQIHRIEIHCNPANLASISIPRKLGFTHEGTLRAKTPFLDRWSDSMIWGLLKEEYPNTPAVKAQIKVHGVNGASLL